MFFVPMPLRPRCSHARSLVLVGRQAIELAWAFASNTLQLGKGPKVTSAAALFTDSFQSKSTPFDPSTWVTRPFRGYSFYGWLERDARKPRPVQVDGFFSRLPFSGWMEIGRKDTRQFWVPSLATSQVLRSPQQLFSVLPLSFTILKVTPPTLR